MAMEVLEEVDQEHDDADNQPQGRLEHGGGGEIGGRLQVCHSQF